MKAIGILLVQLIYLVIRLLHPGGTKSVIAENFLLRHQLLVLNRNRKRAPNLKSSDRVALGLISRVINPSRLKSAAIVVQPATLLKFHRSLVRRKHQRLLQLEIALQWALSNSHSSLTANSPPTDPECLQLTK